MGWSWRDDGEVVAHPGDPINRSWPPRHPNMTVKDNTFTPSVLALSCINLFTYISPGPLWYRWVDGFGHDGVMK